MAVFQPSHSRFENKSGLALGLASLCLFALLFLLVEVVLRATIDEANIDVWEQYDIERFTTYNKRATMSLDRNPKSWDENFDPYLGWDINISDGRVRGGTKDHPIRFDDSTKYRCLAIGDSFTYGSEVNDDETFPYFLGSCLAEYGRAQVLNMGVRGYGIDQAVLKFTRYGSSRKPNVVVFGVHTPNYVRTSVPFFYYFKPHFVLHESGVRLVTDIPPPSLGFIRLEGELESYPSYAIGYFGNRLIRAYRTYVSPYDKDKYYRDMDRIITHIMAMLQRSVRSIGASLVVVQIPLGRSFLDMEALNEARRGEEHRRLIAIYQHLDIPYVDLLSELPPKFGIQRVYDSFYLPRTSITRGHLSPSGNQVVAELICSRAIASGGQAEFVEPSSEDFTSRSNASPRKNSGSHDRGEARRGDNRTACQ